MKDFMWQADVFQVAKFVQACFAVWMILWVVLGHLISPRRLDDV
jgi:hypothetical protein